MSKPVYSIGIIFKNEIRCLERCLKSLQLLREAVACEVVMADTGSTDGSREIAERYADILFDFPWCDDFAAARNAVMDRCSGVWYFSIDADEWLDEDIKELIAFSKDKNVPRDFAGITLHNYQSPGLEKDQNYQEFTAIRMARLSTGIRYEGCIHESWPAPEGGLIPIMTLTHTMLYHDGYIYASKADEKAKHDRNMSLLKKKLAQNPDDIQTLLECIDSSKHFDAFSAEYARQAVKLVKQKAYRWDRLGSVVYRSAIAVAQLHDLPELEEWALEGTEQFPDSIFTQIDVAYYTFVYYFDDQKYTEAILWGERYYQGLKNYRGKRFDSNELSRGVLEFESPFWERKVSILLPQCYLETGEPKKALAGIQAVKGGELEDPRQVELCVNMLMRLHRTTGLDVVSVVNSFWEQINTPFPDEEAAQKRKAEFLRIAANAFTPKYREDEEAREDFCRHSFGVFRGLSEQCTLGLAAVVLESDDIAELENLLSKVKKWGEFPIYALEHGLSAGITFPLPGQTMHIEEMDFLTARMARAGGPLAGLVIHAADSSFTENWQSLSWARGLALAAVKSYNWTDAEQGLALSRAFAQIESAFLPKYYAPELLNDENIHILPPMHRFGWYCGKAFQALDASDSAAYVRLLRQGLETCPEMKPMVEFLLKQLEERRKTQAAPELLALAEQVRMLLAQYPADDPAVLMLKQSEAYRKVAHLIEGPDLGVFGGLAQ